MFDRFECTDGASGGLCGDEGTGRLMKLRCDTSVTGGTDLEAERMFLYRAKLVLGVATLGAAMLLATSAPASAGQFKAAKHHKTTKHSSKGSNPDSSYCQLYKSESSTTSKTAVALEKDIEANNWPAAKKIIISEFSQEGKLVHEFTGALASAPANVRAAGADALKAIPAEEKAVETSTSVAQYESALEKLFDTPQFEAEGKIFEQYESTTCGTTTPTT
jgi:hypothetical protein